MNARSLVLRCGGAVHVGVLLAVVAMAGYFRFVGLNWDELHHLHPDERFLTMVETGIRPVEGGWTEYFDTANSTLNPHNKGYSFFVYGTAPIFAVRYLAQLIADSGFQLTGWGIKSSLLLGTGYDQVHLVGRGVSALADTISVFLLYFIGKRLYNRTVGLLASALSAMAVALIQQAHFFTVDSVANMFVVMGILFAVRAMYSYSVVNYALFGCALGLAVASRINLAPLGLLIILSEFCRSSRTGCRVGTALRIAMAASISLVVFRVTQPYAFQGPSFFDIGLNGQWISNILEVREQMRGNVDFPPNHQWTNRTALIFPLRNMVLWGMGPALGLCAWLGFGWALLQLLRRQKGSSSHLIPVVWSGIYFVWQGVQWVKPMRYFLPVYPSFILLGAWILYELCASKRVRGSVRSLPVLITVLVILFTGIYAIGFSRIYTRPVTRVAASRWIYQNIPGPFSLVIETAESTVKQPVNMPIGFRYKENAQSHTQNFTARFSGVVTAIEIGHLAEVHPDSSTETFLVQMQNMDEVISTTSSSATLTTDLSTDRGYTLDLRPPFSVTRGENYQLVSQAVFGGELLLSGARIINESSWDDGLPLRMSGYDGFDGIYEGHNLELYWVDDVSKRERMLDILAKGDYIFISSNRQYGSIPRLPTRYPLTIAYYDALFSGELGFELAEEFESTPTIGGWSLSDYDAEEPFTVYDHPKVLIFRKVPEFSIEKVRGIFDKVEFSQVVWMNPKDTTAAPTGLLLPPERLSEQRTGGTWSEMFDRSNALNQKHWLGALAWWFAILILGWVMFPLAWISFRGLPDRGYGVSKILALLMVSWLAWILASVRWLPFTRGAIGLVAIMLAVISAASIWRRVTEFRRWIAGQSKYIIGVEALWLFLFLVGLFVRWRNPDLWHPVYGGEKPMDFSYFNAVIRSTSFPPYDPWLAGGYINYYYFGYVMAAVPTKMLGILPSIAYNLLLPMLLAMTGTGAFCVAYNLLVHREVETSGGPRQKTYPMIGGIAAAAMMVLLGNLGQVDTIAKALRNSGVTMRALFGSGNASISKWLMNLRYLVSESGVAAVGKGEWYWNATRVIPHSGGEAAPITEFPLFTFLYADLHAHMLALPITLLAITWALSFVLRGRQSGGRLENILLWGVGGLTIGALSATNTWDFPTYMALGCVAVVWDRCRYSDSLDYKTMLSASGRLVILVALAIVCYQPYAKWFGSGYNAIEVWRGSTTPLYAFLKIHGLFLFIIMSFLIIEARKWFRPEVAQNVWESGRLHTAMLLGVLGLIAMALLVFLGGVQIAPLVLGMVSCGTLLLLQSSQTTSKRVVITMVILALFLTLVVEVLRLEGDISRMNTVFKFYFQAWTLFSITGGVAGVWVYQRVREWNRSSALLWLAGLGILVVTASSYTFLATAAKIADRMAPEASHGLDGMAFMEKSQYRDKGQVVDLAPDYDAIRWLQENVRGSPVIVEAHAGEYKYGSRYTIYTGLPGVVGWSWHQRQQRAVTPANLITERVEDVNRFYRESDIAGALAFLRRYEVRYVVVGGYERVYYPVTGLDKFKQMADAGMLEIAYDNGDVMVYEHNALGNESDY